MVLENLETGDCLFFDFKHKENISNLIVNEELGTALSGGYDRILVQYDLKTGKVSKNYGDIGIYDIQSSSCSGRIAVVGGQTEFRFVNLMKKEIIYLNYIPTDSIYVYTMEFGKLGQDVIMICGGDSDKVTIYLLGEVLNNSILFQPKRNL
jgi:hypothetical protein